MKLIYCQACGDIVQLRTTIARSCVCGESGGRYIPGSRVQAEVWGKSVPIGISNDDFRRAVSEQPSCGWGKTFEAFVIAKECPTITRV